MRNPPQPASEPASRPHYPPPLLLPAEHHDIPRIVQLTIAAEHSDLMSFLRFPTPRDEALNAHKMIQLLTRIFDNPRLRIMKAVDQTSGEIAAVGMWTIDGYSSGGEETSGLKDLDDFTIAAGRIWSSVREDDDDGIWSNPLGQFVSNECRKFLDAWAKPTKHVYLGLLMTDPRFQRRGIGTALLNWGHKVADELEVPSFLVGSPVGRPLYASLGWKEMDDGLCVDLREWTSGGKKGRQGNDKGWGTYKYYFMMRLAGNAEPKGS